MEDLTKQVLDLMAREAITVEQAKRLLLYIGSGGHREQKRRIIERVISGDLSCEKANDLLKALVGEPVPPDAEWEQFVGKLEVERRMFLFFHIAALIICVALLGWFTSRYVGQAVARLAPPQGAELASPLAQFLAGALCYGFFFAGPQILIFWFRMIVECLLRPSRYFPPTFSPRANLNRWVWLLLMLPLNVLAALAFYFVVVAENQRTTS